MPRNPFSVRPPLYGLNAYSDLFTRRQLEALTSISELRKDARERVYRDALAAGLTGDPKHIGDGGAGEGE